VRFLLFGSLRGQKRRARDVDLVVQLEDGETVDEAMTRVAEIGPRVRKPIELWLSRSESEPNVAGNYDHASGCWAFWRRPGQPGFFRNLEPVTLDQVVRFALATGPYGPARRRNRYELDGDVGGPFPGPLEAAAGAEAAAKARGALGPAQVLWFRLEAAVPTAER